MTISIETHPGTADVLLFGDPGHAASALAHAINMPGVADDVRQRVGGFFERPLIESGGWLLSGLNIGAALLGGWYKYRGLQAAARRTLDNPGVGETVRLAEHKIVSKHSPYVDVLVGGQVVGRVMFGIDLSFDIAMLQASVHRGRLTRLSAGECTASILWSVQGFEIHRNEFAPIVLPLHASLGEGIPLIREARAS